MEAYVESQQSEIHNFVWDTCKN